MRRRITIRLVKSQARPVRIAKALGVALAVALAFAGGAARAQSGTTDVPQPAGAPPEVPAAGAPGVSQAAPSGDQPFAIDLTPPVVKSDPIIMGDAGKGMQPMAIGGGLASNGYYRYVDSDEIGNPEAPISDFRDIRSIGTPLPAITDDECVSVALNGGVLPDFSFTYFDQVYTSVFVCGNGQISLGGPDNRFSNACPPTSGAPAGGSIFGLWDDWRVATNGRILTYTFGTAPNRVFVAQWEQVSHFNEAAETVIFQIQILERSSDIRVEYLNVDSGQPDALALYPSPDNRLLVSSETGDKVTRFTTPGTFEGVHIRSGEAGLDGPSGMTIGDGVAGGTGDPTADGVDEVFVSSFHTDRVLLYNGAHPGTQLNDGFFLATFVGAGSGALDGPRGLRYGPDGNLYVSSFNNDRILRYNGTTGAFISTFVAAGSGGLDGPDDLVFGPDGHLYVSSYNTDTVLKYDGSTGALLGTFVASGSGGLDGPRGLAFGPADGNLYVASENNDRVLRYAGGNGSFFNVAVAPGLNGLNEPRYIRFNSVGNLYVVSHGSNRVLEFDVDLVTFLSPTLPSFPEGLVFNGGFLYVSSRSTNEVLRYNATTGAFVGAFVSAGSGGLNGPQDLVFGPNGNLFVSSIFSNEVIEYNGTTGAFIDEFVEDDPVTLFIDEDGGLDGPHGLRFGTGGDLFVASINTDAVKRYNGTTGAYIGNFVAAGSGGLDVPLGIVFQGGDLYVSSFQTDQVKRYNGTTGAFISNFVAAGSGGLDEPAGIVFGGLDNNLYVTNQSNDRVLAYHGTTGAFIGTFAPTGSGGLDGPRMLSFGPDGRLYIGSRFNNQVMTTAATLVNAIATGGDRSGGRSATVGLDGPNGTLGLTYGCNPGGGIGAPIVHEDLAVKFIAPPPAGADLRVVFKRVDNPMPCEDEVITFEIKVQNDGRYAATGVTVLDQLPPGLIYVSSTATQGSYNNVTGIWTVGNLAIAQMETLMITVRVDQNTARTPGRFDSEFVIADGDPSPAPPFGRLRRPSAILRDPATGNWLVSSYDSNEVLRYSSTGAFVDIFVDRQPDVDCDVPGLGCLRGPVGLAIRAGVLYVASNQTNQVLQFDATTGAPLGEFVGPNPLFPFPNGIAGPRGLVFDGAGNLYVSNALNSQVRRYNTAGGFTGVVAAHKDDPSPGVFGMFPNSTLSGPDGIVFGPDRNGDTIADLYVASRNSSEILVFNVVASAQIGTGALFDATDGLSGPTGIVLSPDQRYLYVANRGLSQVLQLDLVFLGPGLPIIASNQNGLVGPEALAIDPVSGNLLVASTDSHQILGFGRMVSGTFEGVFDNTGVDGIRALKMSFLDQQLYAAIVDPSNNDEVIIRRYNPTTGSESATPFFDANLLNAACGIGIGSINNVFDMEITADGKLVFLTLNVSCTFTTIDSAIVVLNGPTSTSPGSVVGSTPMDGPGAFGLAIGDGDDVFVARDHFFFPDDILRFDGATGAFLGVFSSGGLLNDPRGLAYAPDGNLYVANRGPNNILRVNAAGVASDPAGFNPAGFIEDVFYGLDGNLYGTTHPGAVERWNFLTGAALPSFGGGVLSVPGDIVFLPDGDALVADRGNNRIVRFDGHAAFFGVFAQVRYSATVPGLNCARYLTFGPDGNLYVSSEFTDRVLRYNGTTGAFIDTFVDETSGLDGPRDLVFGPDGRLYVASYNNNQILRYNGTTGAYEGTPYVPGFFGSGGLQGPEGLAFGPDDGLLYVSSNIGNQILRYFDTGFLRGFPIPPPFVDFGGSPSLIAPRGLAWGPDGDLYVSTPSGIFQYAGDTGAFVQVFSHGGPLAGAADLTFGPDGNLYVVSSGSSQVLVYQGPQVASPMSPGDFLGEFLITEPGEPAPINPTGLVWGPDGDLFVASCGSHNVIRYRGFIANRATISGNSNPPNNPNDPNLSNNTGTVAVWVQGADLEVEKTVDDNTPYEGDTVIYTITVTNHGPKDAIDVHATDVLPPQLTYVSSTASQGTYTPGTGDWNVGALAFDEITGIGAEATLDIVATVNPGVAAANPIVTNAVTVDDLSPMIGDPDTRNNTASVPIFLVFADLAVTKSVDLPIADEGQTVEFTITVTNNGEDDATGVQIRDRVPSGMAFVSATTPPGTTYNPVSGIWNIGSLPDGAMRTLLLRGQVLSGTGGQVLTNVATVAATSLPDPDLSNDTATADVSVRGADLSIDKTVTPGPYAFGTPVTFTIVVTNNGPLNAVGVTARDRLPVGLTYVSHTASGGTYDPISGVWTIGALANGASRTLTINATFSSAASESATNIATVTALTGDQDLNNNRDAVVLGVPNIDLDIIIVSRPAAIYPDPAESAAALELARDAHDAGEGGDTAPADAVEGPDAPDAADPDAETPRPPLLPGPAVAGNGLFYDITVRNDGTSIATGVVLTLMLDVDVHYVTDNNVPQCVEAPVGFLTCQFGSIPPGGSKTITVQTEVEPDAYYTRLIAAQPLVLTLRAGVTADQDDTDILNDTEVHLTHLVDLADTRIWKISKPDDGIRAGEIFTYTLLVENLGPSHARDLAIDDTLLSSGAFTLVGTLLDPARNDACTVAPAPPPLSGQILRCTLVEPLEPVGSGFGTGRWTVQVTARATQTQDINNEARVYSRDGVTGRIGTPDPRLGNNVAVDSISVLDTSDLVITKSSVGIVRSPTVCATTTSVPNNVTAGERLTWTIIVTNQAPAFGEPGGSIAPNVVVSDFVPAGLEIVSIAGVGPAASAAGCHAGTPGDPSDPARCVFASLVAGASGTVTIVARVNADYVGRSGTNLIVNSAYASSDNIDPFYDDNFVTHITTVGEVADLSIQKIATPSPVIAGRELTYELVIENAGPSNSRSVTVRDTLPAGVIFVGARIENLRDRELCTYSEGAHQVICSLFDVPVGEPPVGGRRIFINTIVRPNTPPGSVSNTALVQSVTPDCNAVNNSTTIVVPVQTQADVSIQKTVEPVKIAAGRQVKYTVLVTNNGPSDAQNVVVTDTLPPEVIYEIDTLQPPCVITNAPAVPQILSCAIGYLPSGQSRSFDIWALVRPNIPAGTTITNNVTVSSETSLGDPVAANNAAFAKNYILSVVDLSISKFGNNEGRVRAGQILTYTVIVDNHGPSFAEGVALKDVLQSAEQFDLIDITSDRPATCRSLANGATETNVLPGTPWPPALPPVPPFGVLEPSGIPLIGQRLQVDCTLTQVLTPAFGIPQLGVLLADGPPNTGRWIVTMRVRFRQAQDIRNVADVVTTSEELDPPNNHAEVLHEITDVANLSVTKTALGEVQVNGQAGRIVNTQAALPVLPEAPFYSGSATQVTAGRRIRYTIRVQNGGPSDAENVLVTDRLPAGVTVLPNTVRVNVDNLPQLPATACQTGTPGSPSDQLTCGLGTLLGVDSAQRRGATITFDVLVDPTVAPGSVLENDVEVRSDVFDPNVANNHAHVQTAVLSSADLSTSKTATGQNVTGYDVPNARFLTADLADRVTAGLVLRYELSVQNAGPSLSRNVTLRDILPTGVTFLRTDGGVMCRPDEVNGGTLYCTVGDMAPGERRTFSLYVLVDRAVAHNAVLRNCVDALFAPASPPAAPSPLPPPPPELTLTNDPLATNNQSCNNTTVNAVADIGGPGDGGPFGDANGFLQKVDVPAEPRLDRSIEPDLAIAGREHRYRITFGNAGPSTAVSVVLTDTLDFKQPGLTGERFLRCEPLDPDDVAVCTYNPVTNIVTLGQLKVHNETIFSGGVGTLTPGVGYGFDIVTIVDAGYVLDAANVQSAGPLNSEAGLIARNTAFLTTATVDFRRQNNRDTERTRIIAEADLAITKTDIFGDFLTCDPVTPGGMVTYQIVATNNGPSDAAEVFVVDQLPIDALAVDPAQVDVTVSAGEVVEVRDDGRITIRVGNGVNNAGVPQLGRLNTGESVTIQLTAMVRQAAKCGSVFANTVSIETRRNDALWPVANTGPAQGPNGTPPTTPRTPTVDRNGANNRAVESTTVACPSINIDKTVSFDGICPGADLPVINETGQPVTFCFEITNTGTTYLDDIFITDTLRSRSTMPTVIFTDTITFGIDPKVPVAPGEKVLRQVTVPQLTRECGNAVDVVEVSANPVNSGRTDLSCLPIVTDSDSVRIEVPCVGVDFRLQLPILGGETCETWIQVQNVGDRDTIPVLVVWGEAGFCPPQAAGPLKVECSGLLRPGSAWSFANSQIPPGANSAVVYSLSAAIVEEQPGQPVAFGRLVCERIYESVVGSDLNWLIFDIAYRKRGTYDGYDFSKFAGEPLAVVVNRGCPDPADPNRTNHAAYEGVSSDLEGAYDPVSGGFTSYAPYIVSGNAGLNTILHIQNSGELCTSLEIWFKDQDNCLRPILGDVIQLSRGETVDFDPATVVGAGWIGSAWIRASQPLGIVVDTMGPNHFTSYVGIPADIDALEFTLGDQVNYAPLIYNEYMGWDTAIQVQNLSATVAAKVKVYFLDFGGGIKQTLVDWICPRGSQSYFLPVIAGLPGNWTGTARAESQEWWTPGAHLVDPPRIQSVVILERFSDPARSERREAVAYNAATETIYDWQLGNGKGGVASGSAVFALPMVAKRNRGVSTEIGIANLVPKPGFTDFAIFLYDQNGLIDFVCEKLGEKQVEYINIDSWGWVRPSFLGSIVVSATFWEHDVFDAQGRFVRNLVGLGAVGIERIGAVLGDPDIPGDESKAYQSFPLFDHFLLEAPPNCGP